jgi:hypothetical protein
VFPSSHEEHRLGTAEQGHRRRFIITEHKHPEQTLKFIKSLQFAKAYHLNKNDITTPFTNAKKETRLLMRAVF